MYWKDRLVGFAGGRTLRGVVPALGVRSPPMDTDESFTFRADKPGTYDYICGLHPFMHGQIVVR